ncbi:MAG: SDR family oxidoreductase [Flavobacteriales bacterium]|nr:SDR family oxidoreductase [Flavobacteriales bacterium]
MNILLTGASSGIGAATARLLAEHGHRVVCVARRGERLKTFASDARQSGAPGELLPFEADVCDEQAMRRAVDFAAEKSRAIDAIVLSAGLGYFAPLDEGKLAHWKHTVEVNINGVLNALHPALPHLKRSRGTVVLIGSVAGRQVFENSGIYCMTKHAVLALAASIRADLRDEVAVSVVNPGAVDTPFIEQTTDEKLKAKYRPNFTAGLSPAMVAEQIVHVLEARGRGVVSEITIRPELKPLTKS